MSSLQAANPARTNDLLPADIVFWELMTPKDAGDMKMGGKILSLRLKGLIAMPSLRPATGRNRNTPKPPETPSERFFVLREGFALSTERNRLQSVCKGFCEFGLHPSGCDGGGETGSVRSRS